MSSYFEFAIEQYKSYQGSGVLMTIFWLAVIILWAVNHHKTNETIKHVISYACFVMLIAVFPPTVKIIVEYCIGETTYWRIFWLLPEVIVLAYFFAQITVHSQGIKRAGVIALVCVMLLSTSDTFLETVQIDESKGTLDISNTVVALCDYIHTVEDNYEEEEIRVIFPNEMITSVRQYDATINIPYGREALTSVEKPILYTIVNASWLNIDYLVFWANIYACNYLVYPASSDGQVEEDLIAAGYEQLAQIDEYYLYHLPIQTRTDWAVISFPDESGIAGMWYILYNQSEEKLIVIDGGSEGNEDSLRSIINIFGNHVNAWILTNYNSEHASLFNTIYSNPETIFIEQIYAPEYDYDYYEENAEDEDDFSTYETFLKLTADAENVTYVHRDDQIQIGSLQIDIMNAYDTLCEETSDDIGNDGGLVMKLTGENQSMLFCSDVYSEEMADLLIEQYGDELQADYVQVANHGQDSLTTDFYEIVNPSVAIFDVPEWLTTDENYTIVDLQKWFKRHGAETVDYGDGPYVLYLQ